MSEQKDDLKIKNNDQKFDSKTLESLQNYIKTFVQMTQIGPLNSDEIQTIIASTIIQVFSDPYEVSIRIAKTIQAHSQAKESGQQFKDAPVIEPEVVKK